MRYLNFQQIDYEQFIKTNKIIVPFYIVGF